MREYDGHDKIRSGKIFTCTCTIVFDKPNLEKAPRPYPCFFGAGVEGFGLLKNDPSQGVFMYWKRQGLEGANP